MKKLEIKTEQEIDKAVFHSFEELCKRETEDLKGSVCDCESLVYLSEYHTSRIVNERQDYAEIKIATINPKN